MRFARKLLVVAFATAAAMAMVAGSASAVTVLDEASGQPCSAVTLNGHDVNGGCPMQATSTGKVELRGILGAMITCDNDFEASIGGDGTGYIHGQTLSGCNITTNPCTSGGENVPWRVEASGTSNPFSLEADFCVVTSLTGTVQCHITDIEINQISHDEAEFTADNGSGSHKFCESSGTNGLMGHWVATSDASHPALEIEG